MRDLNEILENIVSSNDRFRILKLSDTHTQSEILRDLSCSYSDLILWKDHFRNAWLDAYNEESGSNAKKEREADSRVREYEKVKDLLRAIDNQMDAIRSTISANKKQ